MRRIDELHLEYPFAGSRMLRDLLRGEDIAIGRELVATRCGACVLRRCIAGRTRPNWQMGTRSCIPPFCSGHKNRAAIGAIPE